MIHLFVSDIVHWFGNNQQLDPTTGVDKVSTLPSYYHHTFLTEIS